MSRAKKVSFTYINEPQTDSFIYGLIDPRDGQLRYIGQTSCGKKRFCKLIGKHALAPRTYKNSWIKGLRNNGLLPEILIIEECSIDKLSELEIFYIEYFRSLGCRLTNTTEGGEGTRGKRSEETKLKQRKNHSLNKPLINLDSLEVYPSIMECSRQLGLSNGALSDHLNRKPYKWSVDGKQFAWLPKDITDIEGWCVEEKHRLLLGLKKFKRVRCINTGIIYSSIKEAGRAFGHSATWVSSIIRKKFITKPEIDFEFYNE